MEKEIKEYRDIFDKHNVLSRFAGLVMVLAFAFTMYIGLFTDKVVSNDIVSYSSICVMVVFGGVSLISNNMDKILDIVRSFRK